MTQQDVHYTRPRRWSQGVLAIAVCCLASIALAQASFEEQREAISVATPTQPEAAILSLLKAGLAEEQPTQAFAVTQRWLRENVAKDPLLLFHAGQAAERAADWTAAVALYRQYLKRADLQSETASEAILASYTLQINHLDAPDDAYAFSRSEGHRLVVNAQARQFDRWFLDLAKKRNDLDSVAARMLALTQAKVSNDLMLALHETDFAWLLTTLNNGRLDQGRYSPRFIKNIKALAKATTFDKELALLLDWSVSVKAYNMAILDGEQAAPPIGEATALLKAYPHNAERVQMGWAASRGRYYRGDPKKYWPLELEAKLAPVKQAVAKLNPFGQADYYQSYGTRYYDGYPQLLNADEARAWVLANPQLANSKIAPAVQFNWQAITLEDAKKIAPHLAQNPSPEAAGIRAIASINDEKKELDKAVDTLLKSEAWRLSPNELPGYIDRLWHRAGRPVGNGRRDQLIARAKPLIEAAKNTALKKEDPLNKRMAEFKRLWQDYRSNQPKIPGVKQRLLQALQHTPEAMAEILRDPSIEAQFIARQAIETSFISSDAKLQELFHYARLSTTRYNPSIKIMAGRYRSYAELKQRVPEIYKPHPLHAPLEQALTEQLRKGQAEPWLVMAWINATFVEKSDASVKLMADLVKSPAFKALPFEVRNGAHDWFKETALTPAQYAFITTSDPALICKPLTELPDESDVAAVTAALKLAIEGLRNSPTRHEILGLTRLGKISEEVFADPQVLEQIYELAGPMRSFTADHTVANRLLKIISNEPDPAVIHRNAPYIWRDVELYHRHLQQVITLTDTLAEEHPSAAHAMARVGMQTIARHKRGHTYYNRETDIPRLNAIRGKAALKMRLIEIPVQSSHPAYPIYKSQSEYLIGNEDSARELFSANAEALLPVHRELSVPYLLWVLQYTIDSRDEVQQEAIAKALMTWMQETATAFTLKQRIALEIAFGDIALQRGMLPESQKIFANIRNKEDYAASFDRHTASLRLVRVQRISKDFDGAMQTLMELDSEKVPRLVTAAHFARAELYYDMEEYQDSAEEIEKVLERDPEHSDAKILQGSVYLKRQKLIEATEVEIGSATAQASLVPGEMLKVTLNDPTLSVSSGGTDIEVVVTATSGDKEFLLLRQFGDQKTKYRGEVRTALGKPSPGDGVLQVIGDDEVYYAYSERFRKKMINLEENRGGPITIASDALMMASARKLLSENEQRVADMKAATELLDRGNLRNVKRSDPERYARLLAEAAERANRAALQTRVKPGNPIYLRVIDKDRGRTPGIDELAVSLSSSSGDTIGRVVLKETDTHSGQFEGRVSTTAAQAIAFGSSSETGRNPNMVISPKTDYPAWRPVASEDANHTFTIDLNDNAPIESLTLDASDDGLGLKRFIVQTAMDHNSWTSVATFPPSKVALDNPWQPNTMVTLEEGLRAARGARSVSELTELRRHMKTRWLAVPEMAIAKNVAGPSATLHESLRTDVEWSWQGRDKNPAVILRFQAHFYEPTRITRRFALQLGKHAYETKNKGKQTPPEFMLLVDGRAVAKLENGKLDGQLDLTPGLHQIEIWATGWVDAIGFGREVKLQANLEDPDVLVDCPDSFFDPTTFPDGILEHRNSGASIKAEDGGDRFKVDFAPGSRARLIRVLLEENEGPVPSLNRITLAGPENAQLLPVPEDFAELRKNDLLEIVTGDQVTVRYTDDRYVTKGKQRHERFLNVSFTDAKVEFADIEPRVQRGSMKPYHESLLRFPYDKPLSVVIHDADMDESTEPDTITCIISNGKGQTRELAAVETGESTGTFRAWITPVANPTQDKKQIQAEEGGTLTLTYRDAENLKPGVPYDRIALIRHAAISAPRIEIGHMEVGPFEPITPPGEKPREHTQALNESFVPTQIAAQLDLRRDYTDRVKTRYQITQTFLGMDKAPEGGIELVHGRHARIEIVAPHLALGTASKISVYVQTDSGRKASGAANSKGFNINAAGTMHYTATLNAGGGIYHGTPERGGYHATYSQNRGNDYDRLNTSLSEGRFRIAVPLITGMTPAESYADPEAFYEENRDRGILFPHGVVAKTGERIHIGVSYTDANGKKQWSTASAKVVTHPMLDVMQEDYRNAIDEAHVGEKLHLRVVDLAEDRSEERDKVRVYMQSKSGEKHYAILRETDFHSGVFKGVFQLTYTKAEAEAAAADDAEGYDVGRMGFPVVYGDAVGVRYTDSQDRKTPAYFVQVAKGSDGTIAPFSKQYDDSETAMQTQFAMAESFLELARRHRKLGEEEAAAREFSRAKQLLASTIAQFNDPETRSHAEYLLGNLTMEDAEATTDKELQSDRYHAALARYMKVTGSYADTQFASKAQFKIAVIYERLNEPDIAAQEYVKLAYKYPESEHLATSMARLGTHFQRKAVQFEKQAKPLLVDEENKDAFFEGTALKKLSVKEYIKAAQIFERLQTRFPSHELAGMAGLRAGQIYMRAEDFSAGVKALKSVIDNESYDGATLRAEAMYWAGMCQQSLREELLAYALFKRITYDFPESKWAAYARSQLSSPKMLRLDQQLEIERLEAGQ